MKNIALIFLFGFCAASFAETVPFHRLGHPFKPQTNITMVWNAPKNDLPRKVWTYRALPAKVSSDVVSNLVALGGFTEKDQKEIPGYPRLIAYNTPDEKRSLRINPDWAFIDYSDRDADDMHNTNGVLNRKQAFEMAKRWLPKLGINERELFPNPNGGGTKFYGAPHTVFFFPRGGGPAYATNTFGYNVVFYRAIDGFSISGGCARGGGEISFGHDAEISKIMVSWRNYKRDKSYRVASPDTLLKQIRAGKAVWREAPDTLGIDLQSVKKITITKATPLYYTDAWGEDDNPPNAAYPFMELEADADMGAENATFYMDCPIIDETKP